MKMLVLCAVLGLLWSGAQPPAACAAPPPAVKSGYQVLPKPGAKVPLGPLHYFTYAFAKPPKMGPAILRVEIFTKDGVRDTSFAVKGDADMPSMRGMHSSGDHDFTLSTKGVYLLPVQLAMPGAWEAALTFLKEGKPVLRSAYLLDL